MKTTTQNTTQPLFSILIPTWNNLKYLKLCVESIKKNSTYNHQILIYINDGSDGTLEWVKEQNLEYLNNDKNIGICYALNALRPLVKTDYILYMNDDMYACPEWDKYLYEEIISLPDNRFFISATMIQPNLSPWSSIISPADYGQDIDSFDEEKLLSEYQSLPFQDWLGATWPPNIVHKDIWDLVGGYSIEFSPGMYSDPDFSAKLWLAGIRYFKGISKSRVYHFECKSTGRIIKNNGSAQFLLKYGVTSSTFINTILQRGKPFVEHSGKNINIKKLKRNVLRSKFKRLFFITKNLMTQKLWEI